MENKRKIAFFDFCETLVDFQTADAFVDFVREKTQNQRMLKLQRLTTIFSWLKIIRIFETLTRHRLSINKQIILYQLKGFQHSQIDALAKSYYENRIRSNLILPLMDELKRLQNEHYEIVLVSGGYDIYLKYFAEEFSVNNVISSSIGFKNGVCTGRFESIDCLNDNKVVLLNQKYDRDAIYSVAFSDSRSDIPLFKWVNEGYVVSRNYPQRWAKKYKLNEIIWTERKN